MTRRVVITGYGAVTGFGAGKDAFWEGLRQGRSTAGPLRAFDATGLPTRFACEIPADVDFEKFIPNRKSVKTMSRTMIMEVVAGHLAVQDARLAPGSIEPERLAIIMGVPAVGQWEVDSDITEWNTVSEIAQRCAGRLPTIAEYSLGLLSQTNPISILKHLPNLGATHLSVALGARGECSSIGTSCTSSLQAIGDAFRLIRHGYVDAALAGGGDASISPQGLNGFSSLGVLSRRNDEPARACRPFDRDRDGLVMGEGGGVAVLEELEAARRRGARIYAEILGYACAQDAYRLTDEPPDARGTILAIRRALADGAVDPPEIDYINAHGTSTRMNDVTETLAIRQVFGEHARRLAVSSTKSMLGHTFAAAGAVELGACLFALETQTLPPTVNLEHPDPQCDLDYVPLRPRPAAVRTVLKNSFGFGGQNACLILRRVD
jgi:3-oxoacyl-[acyl-carrier-protein] synthase II